MPSLYRGKIPIITRDLNEGFMRGVNPDVGFGCVPRDFAAQPVEMRDSPDKMRVYPQSDWDALYDKGEEAQDSLEHIYLRAAEAGGFEFLDQNGFPDCWCHSTAHAIMVDRLKQNLPYVKLNAVAAATLMGRTDGGWCGLSMKFARENGFPVCGTGPGRWPFQSRRGSDDAALRANMAKFKDAEDWYDNAKQVYDQELSRLQLSTCLFDNFPSPSDYNEFGHSMLSLRWVRVEAGVWAPLTLNSWKGFGYHGLCVLLNRVPDSSCALRGSTPSVLAA